MVRYVIRFLDEPLLSLVNLPCGVELRARRKLVEIAQAASQFPPPGDAQWHPWRGVDLWALDFEVAGVKVLYALDVIDRAVVVRKIVPALRPEVVLATEQVVPTLAERLARPTHWLN